ncbi:MAG: hypothetical protein ACK5CR_01710, partial [Pseudanabaena sp.]
MVSSIVNIFYDNAFSPKNLLCKTRSPQLPINFLTLRSPIQKISTDCLSISFSGRSPHHSSVSCSLKQPSLSRTIR